MYFAFDAWSCCKGRKRPIAPYVARRWFSKQIQVCFQFNPSNCSENIDESLLRFLKMYFPRETKAKQLENERAAGMDQLTAAGFGKGQGNCVIS